MEKLGTNKLNMQKLLAPAALVILYIVLSLIHISEPTRH